MIAELMYGLSFALILIGLWGLLSRRNIFKIVIGFSLLDTGIHILLLTIGYRNGGTAPIFDADFLLEAAVERAVDPVPSALVLTAIVIGLAITALMLSYAVKIYGRNKSLSIDSIKELKW